MFLKEKNVGVLLKSSYPNDIAGQGQHPVGKHQTEPVSKPEPRNYFKGSAGWKEGLAGGRVRQYFSSFLNPLTLLANKQTHFNQKPPSAR